MLLSMNPETQEVHPKELQVLQLAIPQEVQEVVRRL
jgi:hypothetical protein